MEIFRIKFQSGSYLKRLNGNHPAKTDDIKLAKVYINLGSAIKMADRIGAKVDTDNVEITSSGSYNVKEESFLP